MIEIRPISEADIAGFQSAVDTVAREKRFLAGTEGPSIEEAAAFVRGNLSGGNPQFVAADDDVVVGWCDIVRNRRAPMFHHRGTLGMGLLPAWRGRGLGGRLIEAAIAAGIARGISRIELTVRADNAAAIRLYERIGFRFEGLHRGTDFVDGIFHDTHSMALIR